MCGKAIRYTQVRAKSYRIQEVATSSGLAFRCLIYVLVRGFWLGVVLLLGGLMGVYYYWMV